MPVPREPSPSPLLLVQACNRLIDLDAEELISAACMVYAELVQKDVSCPGDLSFSSSKKPSLIPQTQPMAGIFSFRDTIYATSSATNPRMPLFMLFTSVTPASPSSPRFLGTEPSSLVPCVHPGGPGHRTRHSGVERNVTGRTNQIIRSTDRCLSNSTSQCPPFPQAPQPLKDFFL